MNVSESVTDAGLTGSGSGWHVKSRAINPLLTTTADWPAFPLTPKRLAAAGQQANPALEPQTLRDLYNMKRSYIAYLKDRHKT
jgi:hypothetical protein